MIKVVGNRKKVTRMEARARGKATFDRIATDLKPTENIIRPRKPERNRIRRLVRSY